LNYRVQKFTHSGTFITKWGSYGTGDGQFNEPQGIDVDASGHVYVADVKNHRVQKFSSSGVFQSKWGSYGTGAGQFNQPHGIDVDADCNVYVCDLYNNRVQKFTDNGEFLTKWGSYGTGDGQFYWTCYVDVNNSGNIYVTDAFNHRVQVFGYTSSPQISLNPVIVDFGPVVVGDSSNLQIISITDNGTADLSIGTITLSGTNADQFTIVSDNASNQAITPGASKAVRITFTPTKMGAKTATLSIPSNSPTNNPATVTLSGLATKKPPIPVPSSTGRGMVTFDVLEGALILGLTQIAEITLPVNGKPPLNFTYGFFDFNVLGVDPGGSVTITITFPDNIPMNCQYWKYNNGWVNVTSLVGDN